MNLVRPDDWRPRGIDDLEPQAWLALRQEGSACVVAGPGAGKTEFLAQRAAYLLETGICAAPFRVLAISFKSDAADNLAKRVKKRCPPELAHRFTSLTFDAFTKSIVDRFQSAIPSDWRPTRPYEIAFPNYKQVIGFLQQEVLAAPPAWKAAVAGLGQSDFESRHVGAYRLPIQRAAPQSGIERTIQNWWAGQLPPGRSSRLTFVSLNRLAELLLRASPHIQRALQLTYPFVFVDEFQDTTYAQYDFLLSAFSSANIAVTAVGDDKQRIMVWAGARTDAFDRFQADFGAVRIPLLFNFRSSPELVRIQHVVARALDPNSAVALAQAHRTVPDDVAQVWNSPTKAREAQHVAKWLSADLKARERIPRDYAILVKQKSDDFEADLSAAFAAEGLRLRNESHTLGQTTLQDLLSDTFSEIVVAFLRLGSTRRAADAWQLASKALLEIRGISTGDDRSEAKAEDELTAFVTTLRTDMANTPSSAASATMFGDRIIAFLDPAAIARTYVEYSTGDLLAIMAEALRAHFIACATGAASWTQALDAFEGVGQIPLMTVHKSKGLEYDTMIFVGLDDQAWWAHTRARPGDRHARPGPPPGPRDRARPAAGHRRTSSDRA